MWLWLSLMFCAGAVVGATIAHYGKRSSFEHEIEEEAPELRVQRLEIELALAKEDLRDVDSGGKAAAPSRILG